MKTDISILIGGAAGDGIQTIGELLSKACHQSGLFVFSIDDFQSRIRGGHSFHLLRISDQPVCAPRFDLDMLVALNISSYENHKDKIKPGAAVILNTDKKEDQAPGIHTVSLAGIAKEAGGKIAANTVAAGVIGAMIGIGFDVMEGILTKEFKPRGEDILKLNITAARKGYDFGTGLTFDTRFEFNKSGDANKTLSGAQAAALGALAADCRFISFYPMSPGTSIVSSAVPYTEKLPLVIEQAEDELAAVNMAIGASFAGVRSLVSTSGGGFCLMTEGLGLAAMSEVPLVIINAQRPGPATGLATRTAQADLMFCIHASQDEFPRFVLAPGGVFETYQCVKRAFYLSEKYQVPVIVLMDQFLADSKKTESKVFEIGSEHTDFLDHETDLYRTQPYTRYRITQSGVSPRKTPCTSESIVRSTGNEHTPPGLSSEDPSVRTAMVEKRFRKVPHMEEEMRMPWVFSENSDIFLTGWGSTKGSIVEAGLLLREQGIDVGWIIFEDLWPLNRDDLKKVLENKQLIVVEANATAQLGSLIKMLTGIQFSDHILKYDGRPIDPAFIMEQFMKLKGKENG